MSDPNRSIRTSRRYRRGYGLATASPAFVMSADIGPRLTLLASQCAPSRIDVGQLGGNLGFHSRAIRCASSI
jgi:hypothetical protein